VSPQRRLSDGGHPRGVARCPQGSGRASPPVETARRPEAQVRSSSARSANRVVRQRGLIMLGTPLTYPSAGGRGGASTPRRPYSAPRPPRAVGVAYPCAEQRAAIRLRDD
jgi:hypothetical protein